MQAQLQSTNASVITVNQGSVAAIIVGGSIAASFTPPANQSVSGNVGIVGNPSISGTVLVNNGSVVAFQGGAPWSNNINGSVATVIIGGSIAASFTPPANQSVSGTVQTQVQASVAVVIIGGSILTSSTANQSVSGTVGASIIGLPPVNVTNTNLNVSGSVVSFQGGTWSQSVVGQGAAGALTNGWPVINGEANDSTGTFTNATQTTSVTNNNLDGYGNSLISINGTYGTATAIFEGSDDSGVTWYTVAAARDDTNVIETGYTSLTNISRSWQINNSGFDSIRVRSTAVTSGTVNVRISSSSAPNSSGATVGIGTALPSGSNLIGSVLSLQGTTPWLIGSVYGNISGSVAAFQAGTQITSLVSITPSSVQVGASIFGQLPAGTAMLGSIAAYQGAVPWAIAGSVAAVVTNTVNVNTAGSVVTFQGTSPWVVNYQNSSILAVPVGSVITVFQAPSIVGTYAEDAPSASGDKGFLVMGARNDTLASVTSNDGDYSSHVVGPAGELIAENAPLTKWISGTASALGGLPATGSLIPIIAAQGASVFTYITSLQIANPSATNVWVTFLGATNSVIGYTMAPANGGSNISITNGLKTNANAAFSASVNAVGSVYLSAQGFISKT